MTWIAVDWGTSNLRVWNMTDDGTVLESRSSEKGMGRLKPDEFEAVLIGLVDDWLKEDGITTVLACGMVGARQGWVEAPYKTVPCSPAQGAGIVAPVRDPRIAVTILPGLCQYQPSADVMRGEETQIAGYIAQNPEFSGVLCLPGTHTKWVEVSGGQVLRFKTFMTGEAYALYSGQSVLRHSVAGDGLEPEVFKSVVSDAVTRPELVPSKLFEIRADDLLNGQSGVVAGSKLSGLLIGQELAAARDFWDQRAVALIGAETLCSLYSAGLGTQGYAPEIMDVTAMTLSGLTAVYRHIKEN